MRFGCCLVAVSMIMSCWATPKAKAVVSEGALLGSIFGSLLVSMGYSWAAENMDMPSFGEAIYKEMKEFDEALKNNSGLSFFADLNLTLLTPLGAGKIGFPAQWVRAANSFAEWFEGKFFTGENTTALVSGNGNILNYENDNFKVNFPHSVTWLVASPSTTFGYYLIFDKPITFTYGCPRESKLPDGQYIYMLNMLYAENKLISDDGEILTYQSTLTQDKIDSGQNYVFIRMGVHGGSFKAGEVAPFYEGTYISVDDSNVSASLTAEKPQEVHYPDVAEDGSQVYEITVDGVTATDIEGIIQGAVDQILAGTAAIAGTVALTQAVPVEPEAPPELDGLDLPALGAALTTRFPFSIPWDVARGIEMLAAPAEAPYWEVDFLAPLGYRVGGWKGSTMVVLDFSQFEVIGQVTRWMSTIGFCLMLASSTKRLIWVA